jgi:hypothetical protein
MMARARSMAILAALACAAGCGQEAVPEEPATASTAGCLPSGDGRLEAELRGAIQADLEWNNAQMECDGGPRPDGRGLRVSIAGALDADRRARFIFGIGPEDIADGPADVHPVNLTVFIEDHPQVYATRGDDTCAVENLERTALEAGGERVAARGYCISPSADLSGGPPLHVTTFSFTALVREEPADGEVLQ